MKRTKMKRTKRVLGLALAAVMCMGMLANSDTAYAASGTETSEKVLNIATIGETTTLSPLYMIADNRPTQKLLYEGLVKYVDGEIQPVLAEDWEMSEDGKQLTFYLRQGVTFHDGEPFNAEAAIANIEAWHINPSFTALPGVVNYTNIEAVDEYTIRLTYDTPYFAYINDFCWPDVCTMISPKQITQGDFQTVNGYAGTGPYIYDEYVAGQYTTFVRNENYWGGATLSGGEKQRISIARAILKDTPIIILDEATSSVDPENEAELQQAIEKLTEDKTVIIIAHRLKTVRNAQQIVVIANGGIAQRGTHQELMTQPGIYADFVNIREKAVNWKISSSKIQQ